MAVVAFVTLAHLFTGKKGLRNVLAHQEAEGIRTKFIVAIGGVSLIFVILGTVLFLGGDEALLRGVGLGDVQSDISSGRTHFWPIALQIFYSHPIIGAGLDAFGVGFTKFDTWNGTLRVERAHNEYLQTLADAGIAGFICVAAYIYFLFKRGLTTITNAEHGFKRDAAIGALAGCFGILIHSFFDFPLRTPSNAFFFLLLSAIATVSVTSNNRRKA
jgi:O-antigen ligase